MLTKEVMAAMRTGLNAVAKEYGAKLSIRKTRNTLRITILSSPIDFHDCALLNTDKYNLDEWKNTTVNPYCYKKHWSGEALEMIDKLLKIAFSRELGYYDNSISEADYFDTAWYVILRIGDEENEYQVVK
jgi:hypothetical protein